MALLSENVAIAVALQPTLNTYVAPTQPADLMPVSNLVPNTTSVRIANDEATGSPVRNADQVSGSNSTISFNLKIRPPAGGAVPAADTFNLGKVLRAAKMTEVLSAAPLVASEAFGAVTDNRTVQLGAAAAAVADTYKALPIMLEGQAAYKDQLNAVRSYAGTKDAVLMADAPAAIAGNYNVPAFIGYARSVTSDEPELLSFQYWLDGHRHDCMNGRVSALQLVLPTSTREQAQYPELRVTLAFDYVDRTQEESTPAVPALGAVPFYNDGVSRLDYFPYCTSTLTVDFGIQTEYPPCPNSPSGSDPAQLVSSTASVAFTAHHYLPSQIDPYTLASNQQQHPFIAQYGDGPGNAVQLIIPDARLDFPNEDTSGTFILDNGTLLIDAFDRGVAIMFPF